MFERKINLRRRISYLFERITIWSDKVRFDGQISYLLGRISYKFGQIMISLDEYGTSICWDK